MAWAGLVPSEVPEGESVLGLSQLLVNLVWQPWLVVASLQPLLLYHMAFPEGLCRLTRTPVIELGASSASI